MATHDLTDMAESRHEAHRAEARRSNGAEAILPPLENGDRLTRAEFERRYEAMPHLMKAELVEGVVYVSSPVRYTHHGQPNRHVETWLGVYEAATPGVGGAGNVTVRLDLDNEPRPDSILRIEQGGSSWIDEDGYLVEAPELVVEVAASSASYDLHDKLRAYRRNGVQEYVVWRVLDGALDWLVLREGTYVKVEPDAAGILKSTAFPGLWLNVKVLLARELPAVLATLQEGLASAEHGAFVARLREVAPRSERA
jgi:Uma2 family endonuclease